MELLKTIATSIYASVFVAYKSTLFGLVLLCGAQALTALQAATLPSWAHTLVVFGSGLFVMYRGQHPEYQLPAVK